MESIKSVNMNKDNLKKLSKSELINLLLKQDKKKTEIIIVDDTKPISARRRPFPTLRKNVKQMAKEYEEKNAEIDEKYNKLITKPKKVYDYPMIKATLQQYRIEEIKMSNDSKRSKKSFSQLFEARIDNIKGDTEKVSLFITVEITKSLLGLEENVFKRTYGPFTVDIPKGLSIQDTYKFALYTLLRTNITFLSGEYITKIGARIIQLNEKHFKHHKMGKLKLESYLLNKQRPIKSHGVNTCVIDYVWDQVRGRRGFKTYTYDKLKSEIYDYVPEGDMINTEELINWAKERHDNVSIHAFDCRYRKFITHSKNCSNISLVYIVKDHHCYPITDEKLKIVASKANQGSCNDLLKHISDLKWTRRHENVTKIELVDEITNIVKENHIVVLPENVKMKEAIDMYSRNKNFYVEFLHWNNNGILDGFIDHNKSLYLLNEEYDRRKKFVINYLIHLRHTISYGRISRIQVSQRACSSS